MLKPGYECPRTSVLEFEAGDVLCVSDVGNTTHEGFTEDSNFGW